MNIKVLGSIEVAVDGRVVHLVGQRQRALLAALVLDHGKAVPVARLVDVLWGDSPPATALAKVQAHVSGLRQALGDGVRESDGPLQTCSPGYLLSTNGVDLDLSEFERLVTRGTEALGTGQLAMAAELLGAGLDLWRGAAFADVASPLIQSATIGLQERRLLTLEAKTKAELTLGRCERVLAELPEWVAANPLREHLRALLMVALYRRGCRADALGLYHAGRGVMISELGLEPGPHLVRVQQLILSDDPLLWTASLDVLLAPPVADTSSTAQRHP